MSSGLCCCAQKLDKDDERKIDNKFYRRPVRIGHSYLLCGKKNTAFPYQCFVGPEWTCMIITNALIIVPTYFFVVSIAKDIGIGMMAAVICTCALLLFMFSATACSDPGIVFVAEDPCCEEGTQAKSPEEKLEQGGMLVPSVKLKGPPDDKYIACGFCGIDRPRTASHCYECGLCVDHLDHHCPWTGKCIAKKNLDRFYYFLYSLLFHVIVVVSTLVYHLTA
jgi:hypothetical protein